MNLNSICCVDTILGTCMKVPILSAVLTRELSTVVWGQKPFVTEEPTVKQEWPGMGPALEVDEGYEVNERIY